MARVRRRVAFGLARNRFETTSWSMAAGCCGTPHQPRSRKEDGKYLYPISFVMSLQAARGSHSRPGMIKDLLSKTFAVPMMQERNVLCIDFSRFLHHFPSKLYRAYLRVKAIEI